MSAWLDAALEGGAALEDAEGTRVSAEALRARVEARAEALREAGLAPGERVLVAREKSVALVVDLLAIARAGGVMVPVDPRTPRARLERIARDAQVAMWIDDAGLRVLEGERASEVLAYVIYTSGSSGTPKGVRIGHEGLLPMLRAQIAAFALEPSSRVLAFLSPGFDAFLSDVLTTLVAGATLVLERAERLASIDGLMGAIEARRITHLDLPPALVPRVATRSTAGLRTVIVGGEASEPEALRSLARRVRVVNVYGPTEATICTSLCVVDAATWSEPLLGEPLPGVRYREVEGELWIASAGLARGYVGREEETARAFVEEAGTRWYRTGDRVQRAGDAWVFAGRVDRQVKIAGVRIELDEVEALARGVPGVEGAAAVLRGEGMVVVIEGAVREEAVRAALREALPRAAVPRRVVRVAALPRTESAKVDRAAVQGMALPEGELAEEARPRGATEALVASMMARVLARRAVGREESFWALGGDSFAAIELCALGSALGAAIEPSWLAESASVAALAARVEARAEGRAWEAEECAREGERAWRELLGPSPSLGPRPRPSLGPSPSPSPSPGLGPSPSSAMSPSGVISPLSPQRVTLLAGATGALGVRVLVELVSRSPVPIVCLVRARTDADAQRRLDGALRRAGLALDAAARARVHALAGDLVAPALGLDEETYAWLAAHASLVVHAAGSVRTTQSYDALFADNVRSTAALAALALHADARVVLASSLAPFVCCEAPPACVEEHDVAPSTRIHGAYAATKLMAEHALAASGARACIVRLGLLTPCASTLRAHDACQLSLFLRGMAAIGAAPITRGTLACDATPIDRAAHALASLALDAHALGTFHVAARAPITLDALLDALAAAGAPLPRVPAAAFADAIARAIAARGDVGTAALGLARRSLGAEGARESDLFLASATRFDTRRASAFTPPIDPPDAALLARYARAALEGDSTR